MSRTYKCTKGASKKLKPVHESFLMYIKIGVRREKIDYENCLSPEMAKYYRQGKRNKRPDKGFRKIHEAKERIRAKEYLFNCTKDENFWYGNAESLKRKCMSSWWY